MFEELNPVALSSPEFEDPFRCRTAKVRRVMTRYYVNPIGHFMSLVPSLLG